MAQQTSIDAYANVQSSGVVSDIQTKVLDVIRANEPITQGETWNEHFPESQRHTIAPRFAELKNLGLIASYDKRKCRFSKITCMTWETVKVGKTALNEDDLSENLPVKKTVKQLESDIHLLEVRYRNEQESNAKLYKLVEELRAEIDNLHKDAVGAEG